MSVTGCRRLGAKREAQLQAALDAAAQLLYAKVVKQMRRRRIVEVKHRVVFGTKAAVDQGLAVCGWQIKTAFVERLNLSLRQRVAAMRRRSATPCKSEDGLGQPLILFQVYPNFVLPHAS